MKIRVTLLVLGCVCILLSAPMMAFQNGNQNRSTYQASGTTDTTGPDIAIATPTDGSTVSGRYVNVTFYAWDSGSGLSKFELYVDGTLVSTISVTSRNLYFQWRTGKAAPGNHVLEVMAYDRAGNNNISAPVTVTLVN